MHDHPLSHALGFVPMFACLCRIPCRARRGSSLQQTDDVGHAWKLSSQVGAE